MKRGLVFAGFIFLILLSNIILAEENTTDSTDAIQEKVDQAYTCLENQIATKSCNKLSTEEKIFALLSVGACESEVISSQKMVSGADLVCWPESGCKLKTTAQALLALDRAGIDSEEVENWLMEQNKTPSDIDWFLQIDTDEVSECTIKYSTSVEEITINADKTISGSLGGCLSKSTGNWWVQISPSCYGTEFEISCDKAFSSNLLFKDKTSSTIHVLEKTSSSSAEGTTREKVDSLCFEESNTCNFEGSLWAALALKSLGYSIKPFLPYIITASENNPQLLPEVFLYILTGSEDFRNNLLQKQRNDQYWDESGNKFYDTALALYPFQYSDYQEKTNAIAWLFEVQQNDGCWSGGDVLKNAFLLYSIWPKALTQGGASLPDCQSDGSGFCMAESDCKGEKISGFSCTPSAFICCNKAQNIETCSVQDGQICSPEETCYQGITISASDLESGEVCCLQGRCEKPAQQSECEERSGTCRSSCNDDESEETYSCDFEDTCCMKVENNSYWWIWVLAILILLLLLALFFRNRIRAYFFKPRSNNNTFRRFPPSSSIPPMSTPRRILPQQMMPMKNRPQQSNFDELGGVLNKLKEMSK